MKHRIIFVDDDVAIIRCVGRCLNELPDVEVVGYAEHAQAGVALALECLPDVVLMDIHMPGADAFWACRSIREKTNDKVRVLFYTGFPKDRYLDSCLEVGGMGVMSKHSESLENISLAIKHVVRGERYFSPELAKRLEDLDKGQPKSRLSKLTERELNVMRLLAAGKSNREIADELKIGLRSVEKAVFDVKKQLDLATTNELLVYAAREGIVFPELANQAAPVPPV